MYLYTIVFKYCPPLCVCHVYMYVLVVVQTQNIPSMKAKVSLFLRQTDARIYL